MQNYPIKPPSNPVQLPQYILGRLTEGIIVANELGTDPGLKAPEAVPAKIGQEPINPDRGWLA